jgi:glycosyltransferase involved in cell wall biosynthesis
MKKITFVIPCYRSAKTIGTVINEIENMLLNNPKYDFEIIAVNDCSPDNVWEILSEYASQKCYLKIIDLAKNQGKHAALMAGYRHASGDIVISVDDDGQCPMDHLWELIEPLEEGYDIAIAKYPQKKQSMFKNFGSEVNSFMAQVLIGKPRDLSFSNFLAMKRFVCEEIIRYKHAYPYVDGLLLRTTSKICNVLMEERERISGTTGYTFSKSLKLWLNGFTAFSVKPLRIATVLGMACTVIGVLYGLYVVVRRILNPEIAAGYSSLMAVLLFVSGVIMVMLGMIGEYVGRIYISINESPQYVVREMINIEKSSNEQLNG